jgi:hypothetical protein
VGRPTLAAQIAKAAAEGNMEKVKELADKLTKQKVPVKAKAKTNKKLILPRTVDDKGEVEEDAPAEDFIVTAKNPNHREVRRTEDGEDRVVARIVPFKVVHNRKNTWADDITEEANDIEFDKLVHKNGPRSCKPRPTVTKIEIKCTRCNRTFEVWPGEIKHKNWACDPCLVSNGRSRD